jgi:hypothetical protein
MDVPIGVVEWELFVPEQYTRSNRRQHDRREAIRRFVSRLLRAVNNAREAGAAVRRLPDRSADVSLIDRGRILRRVTCDCRSVRIARRRSRQQGVHFSGCRPASRDDGELRGIRNAATTSCSTAARVDIEWHGVARSGNDHRDAETPKKIRNRSDARADGAAVTERRQPPGASGGRAADSR